MKITEKESCIKLVKEFGINNKICVNTLIEGIKDINSEQFKKYTLSETEIKNYKGIVLKRIIYNDNSKGGWLESYDNLSQDGDCKVYDNAYVYGNSQVFENAKIFDYARVYGNAKIYGNAIVYGNAEVYENAKVFGNARVHGNAIVYGNAEVYENAKIFDYARVHGNAKIK